MPPVIGELRRKGIECLAAALYRSQPLGDAKAGPGGVCVVIGSEGQGLTEATHRRLRPDRPHPHDRPGGKPERRHCRQHPAVALPGGRAVTAGLWTPAEPVWAAGAPGGPAVLAVAGPHPGPRQRPCRPAAGLVRGRRPPGLERAGDPRLPGGGRPRGGPPCGAADNTPEAFRPLARRCQALGVQVIPFDHPRLPPGPDPHPGYAPGAVLHRGTPPG